MLTAVRCSLLAFIGFAVTWAATPFAAAPPPEIKQHQNLKTQVIAPAVMVGSASGVAVDLEMKGRVILTCAHVVGHHIESAITVGKSVVTYRPPAQVSVGYGGPDSPTIIWANIVKYDADADLALLKPVKPAEDLPLITFPQDDPRPVVGEDAWYCGTGSGVPWNLDKSIINQVCRHWVTVNGNVWYGHSGSGVYVRRGDNYVLVGLVAQAATLPVTPKIPAKCVSWSRIKKFLDAYHAE